MWHLIRSWGFIRRLSRLRITWEYSVLRTAMMAGQVIRRWAAVGGGFNADRWTGEDVREFVHVVFRPKSNAWWNKNVLMPQQMGPGDDKGRKQMRRQMSGVGIKPSDILTTTRQMLLLSAIWGDKWVRQRGGCSIRFDLASTMERQIEAELPHQAGDNRAPEETTSYHDLFPSSSYITHILTILMDSCFNNNAGTYHSTWIY